MLSAAAVLMITMGSRQTVGLFIAPIDHATGLGIVSISFALAIGQFVWGLAQPIFGMFADKQGPFPVLVTGSLVLAAGLALTPWSSSKWALVATQGILSAAGAWRQWGHSCFGNFFVTKNECPQLSSKMTDLLL